MLILTLLQLSHVTYYKSRDKTFFDMWNCFAGTWRKWTSRSQCATANENSCNVLFILLWEGPTGTAKARESITELLVLSSLWLQNMYRTRTALVKYVRLPIRLQNKQFTQIAFSLHSHSTVSNSPGINKTTDAIYKQIRQKRFKCTKCQAPIAQRDHNNS